MLTSEANNREHVWNEKTNLKQKTNLSAWLQSDLSSFVSYTIPNTCKTMTSPQDRKRSKSRTKSRIKKSFVGNDSKIIADVSSSRPHLSKLKQLNFQKKKKRVPSLVLLPKRRPKASTSRLLSSNTNPFRSKTPTYLYRFIVFSPLS